METGKEQFLRELKTELKGLPNRDDIILEYESHLYELAEANDVLSYEDITGTLGRPRQIAEVWKQETGVTPKKMQWLFVLLNGLIFAGGTLLTVFYHVFHWQWIEVIWQFLMSVPFLLLIGYLLFWALVGYEIGREFGHYGKTILRRTFFIAIIPNLVLMYVVVFRILPYEWFDHLLTGPFITLCIFLTGIIYPVSYLGYKWGKRVSI